MQAGCLVVPDAAFTPEGLRSCLVDAAAGVAVQVRDYQRLFRVPNPASDTLLEDINPDSVVLLDAVVEPAIMASGTERFQFERQGYFCKDSKEAAVFNKTVSLREGF